LSNNELLGKLNDYITNTNFQNQILGHNLTLSFLPPNLTVPLQDKRYSLQFKHKLLDINFTKVTFSEILINLTMKLNEEIKNIPEKTIELYKSVGLIEDNKCTKELISTIVSNGIALNSYSHEGNKVEKMKYTDNLCNIFPEFDAANIDYFLEKLDNYKLTEI